MSHATTHPHPAARPSQPDRPSDTADAQASPRWRTWLVRSLALLGVIGMLLYGLAAIEAGIVNYRAAGSAEAVAQRQAMQARAEAGQPLGTPSEVAAQGGTMLSVMAQVSSPSYTFGEKGLSETLIHYATMPRFNGVTLSIHNVLGGITMLFGALQFWPAFRRQYPKWHRAFGLTYIVAAQCAMIAAMIFLVRTPVHLIYDQLTFYIGLWGLAIGVTVTLWMAIYSMARKRIAQHQAWMALNYGMLLTAPIQRYGWLAFGAAAPDLRQLEGNYAVTAVLVPLCVMIGYALFTLNRWLQQDRPAAARARVAEPFQPLSRLGQGLAWAMIPVLGLALWTTLTQLTHADALSRIASASTLIPAGVMSLEQSVLSAHPLMHGLFVAATVLGLLSAAAWLARTARVGVARDDGALPGSARLAGSLLALAGATVGVTLLLWGWRLGMPSFATLHGGALHLFGGGILLVFSVLMARALALRQDAWAAEWSWFIIAALVASPSLHWMLPVIGQMPIEAQYIESGHAFRLAAYGQWMLLIGAFLCAIHSQATHAKLAR